MLTEPNQEPQSPEDEPAPEPLDPNRVFTIEELSKIAVNLMGTVAVLRMYQEEIIRVLNINSKLGAEHKEAINKLSQAFEQMDARLDVIKSRIKGEAA